MSSLDEATLKVLQEVKVPGTENFFGKVAGMFLSEFGPKIQQIRAAVDAQDAAGASVSLHSLKGSCLYIGASRLAAALAGLERDVRSGNLSEASKILEGAEKEFAVVRQALEKITG